MRRKKLLCVLHRSPPFHGAAKVGDFISSSTKLNKKFDCKFITIKSAETLDEIGKINFKKLFYFIDLYIKVLWAMISFKPDKIYFTASVRGIAFYRDLLLSTLWKVYGLFLSCDVYYHYHTKGIDEFVSQAGMNLVLTNFFIKNVNIILLSPLLKKDLQKLHLYKAILYLPNGVEDNFKNNDEFSNYINNKNFSKESVNILYLSNMIKSKGYFEVLKLAKKLKNEKYTFHFAGGWQKKEDEMEFFNYIDKHNLKDTVVFHGFVNGVEKDELFKKTNIFIFPTRYKNEAFPLSVLESLAYGVPVIATDEGSIPYIVDDKTGCILHDKDDLYTLFEVAKNKFINKDAALCCRQRYLKNFSLKQFEINLINIM